MHIQDVTVLHDEAAFVTAAIALLEQASRYVRIRSADLDPALFDNRDFAEALSEFARKSRYCEVQVLVDATERLLERESKVVALMRRLSPKIIIKRYYDEPDMERDSYLLCDFRGVLVKPVDPVAEGFFSLTDSVYTKHMCEIFDHEWQYSSIAEHLKTFTI